MDALAQSITSADRGTGSVGPVSWGPIPADGDEWNIALHHMVSYIFGDGLLCGSHKPQWYCDCAEYFLAGEEERRGLPRNSLGLLIRMPYLESVTKTEYAWGKKKAFLFGVGEQFGQWEAYWCVYIKGDFATGQVPLSMEVGQIVLVGGAQLTFVRALGSTKPAGKAGTEKMQRCFCALLHDGTNFLYVGLQHVSPWYPRIPGYSIFDEVWDGQGASSLLTAHSPLLTCSLLTAHSSLLTPHCSLLSHSSLRTPHLLTPHSSLLTPHS